MNDHLSFLNPGCISIFLKRTRFQKNRRLLAWFWDVIVPCRMHQAKHRQQLIGAHTVILAF